VTDTLCRVVVSLLCSVSVTAVAQDAPAIPAEGLIAYYPFNGNASDEAGDCDGQVRGAVPTQDRFGNDDRAYQFDGIDDDIIIDPPPELSRDGLTISVWARFDLSEIGGVWQEEGAEWRHPIIGQDDGIAIRIFQLHLNDRRICWHRLFWYTSECCEWQAESDRWYHIAVVWDGEMQTHSLYVDGAMEQEGEGRFNVCRCQPIHIGSKGELGKQTVFFSGAIDDIRIYNRALADDEIMALYGEGGWTGAER
jgi:hypothetical protein